jgi:hypothetical protein
MTDLSHLPIWHPYRFYPGPKLYQLTGFDIIFNSGSPVVVVQTLENSRRASIRLSEIDIGKNCKLNPARFYLLLLVGN